MKVDGTRLPLLKFLCEINFVYTLILQASTSTKLLFALLLSLGQVHLTFCYLSEQIVNNLLIIRQL